MKGSSAVKATRATAAAQPAPTTDNATPVVRSETPGEREPLFDRMYHAGLAQAFGGLSPMSVAEAWFDWSIHLAASPARRLELARQAWAEQLRLLSRASQREATEPCSRALPQDKRFRDDAWRHWPFNVYAEAFLSTERWWDAATSQAHGASPHHLALLNFVGRQALDMAAPSNFIATNPVVIQKTVETNGANLLAGAQSACADALRAASGGPASDASGFAPGKKVALTKGQVVARNALAEIIQYSPSTQKTRPDPIVIVPAWIMKYYILDLSPENSLIKALVDKGFTVFAVSWKNPDARDREIGFEDYRRLGAMEAISAALAITGARAAHVVGYCLGGTLAAVAAAGMARDHDERVKSLTLLAAQTDFEEAGELKIFIDESQLAALDDVMWAHGTLEAGQMAGAFNLLRSNDLIWSRLVHHYLMGEPEMETDMSAWSKDATRLPYRMHSEYLRRLYLTNDLAEGRFDVEGRPVALRDIRTPIFALGTEWDHVAPWRSVFKIHALANADVTFALTNGGHNQGVVSPPGRPDRHFRVATTGAADPRPNPDDWFKNAPQTEGSWWPAWFAWLEARSGALGEPPPMGRPEAGLAPLQPAPGSYVLG